MRLFSYVVARDFGFAPNPFFGTCTLATCKPQIRKAAHCDDWVVGTGSKSKHRERHLVFAMKVTETMTFNDYWSDERFQHKKPNLAGSKKQAFGDNVYCREQGLWIQTNSHHSHSDGSPNENNIRRDTQVDRVLVSDDFTYFGGAGPAIPDSLDICKRGPGHRNRFSEEVVAEFVEWIRTLERGFVSPPDDWRKMPWVPFHLLLRQEDTSAST